MPTTSRVPARLLQASVTKACELFNAGEALHSGDDLRRAIDLPGDLDVLDADERKVVEQFLGWARSNGADQGYIARHREAVSGGLLVCAGANPRYLHGPPSPSSWGISPAPATSTWRTACIHVATSSRPCWTGSPKRCDERVGRRGPHLPGGLTKFEPREMERLPVPGPEHLTTPFSTRPA